MESSTRVGLINVKTECRNQGGGGDEEIVARRKRRFDMRAGREGMRVTHVAFGVWYSSREVIILYSSLVTCGLWALVLEWDHLGPTLSVQELPSCLFLLVPGELDFVLTKLQVASRAGIIFHLVYRRQRTRFLRVVCKVWRHSWLVSPLGPRVPALNATVPLSGKFSLCHSFVSS